MDIGLTNRVQQSFRQLAPRGPELVDHLFAHLFSKNPQLRPLFPRDMSSQKKNFLATFMLIMRNLSDRDKLRHTLIDLGRRHFKYDARPDQYPLFRDTLIGVMRDMSGAKWNPQLAADWTIALNVIAALMIEGHKLDEKRPRQLTAV